MKRNRNSLPLFLIILIVITGTLVIVSLFSSVLWPIDLGATDLRNRLALPSIFGYSDSGYLFGTDYLGRDLGIRLMYATRNSVILCAISIVTSTTLGIVLGTIAGMFGGKADDVIVFLVNVRHAIPAILIGIIASVIFGSSPTSLVLLNTFIQWTNPCRQVRASILQIKNESFIEASRSIGSSTPRIIWEHVLRNVASPLIVVVTMSIGSIILFESTLSFLGLGILPPNTSLGVMVAAGRDQMILQWWQAILPTAIICLIVMTTSLLGDWLRNKLDPKLRKR